MIKRSIAMLVLIAASPMILLGCQPMANAQTSETVGAEVVARLIVKPRESIASGDALMKKIAERLPHEHRLRFFREMSMNAYVLNVMKPAKAEDIPKIVADLNGTGIFEYVEIDRRMTTQPPRGNVQ